MRNRKRLRPNVVSEYELRIRGFRVFYDVDENEKIVKIKAIGHKEGSFLLIRGKEFKL
jgi:mRNA-degrading endonuclease RelE of RelBE toxin-antitoxin system